MPSKLYRVREGHGINYPKPGHVPPEGQRCDSQHELRAEGGAVVDLSHLRPQAIEFYLAHQVVEEASPDAASEEEPARPFVIPGGEE